MYKFELVPNIIPTPGSNSSEIFYSGAKINVPYRVAALLEIEYKSVMTGIFFCPKKEEVILREKAQFWKEYNAWLKNLKAGQRDVVAVKIDMERPINNEAFDTTIVSIEGSRIITKIGRRRVVFMLGDNGLLKAKRGGLYVLYPVELYYTIDLSTDEQIVQDRDVPPEILRLRNIIIDRLSHINFDRMRVKGEIYTVIKRLPGWNVVLLPDGRYGLFAASLDDRYGEIEF